MTPASVDTYLSPGERYDFSLEVRTKDRPKPIDVLFVFDTSESMENVLEATRDTAREISTAISQPDSDVRVGVATFTDYGQTEEPWRLRQDLTQDAGKLKTALDGIALGKGGDHPEAYTRALFEARSVHWRDEAHHFLVLFGDAPAHDRDFYDVDWGPDPGPDAVPGTSDDLQLARIIRQLAHEKIMIVAIHDPGSLGPKKPLLDEAIAGFRSMAAQTGGITLPLGSASRIATGFMLGLGGTSRSNILLAAPSRFSSWVTWTHVDVRDEGRELVFPLTLRAPDDLKNGIYQYPIMAIPDGWAGGPVIGRTWMTVRIGLWNYPWRPILIPAYIVLAALAGFLLRRRRRSVLYRRSLSGAAIRTTLVVLAIAGALLLWYRGPGNLSEVIRADSDAPTATLG